MSTYISPTASGNARQHNGHVYNNNNSTNTYNVQNQLPRNPLTDFMSTQGQATELHKACAKGDEGLVRSLLQQSTGDLEVKNDEWLTPLQLAVCKNKAGVARILLEFGANIEAREVMWVGSQRPIFLAISNGNEEMVQLLVDASAEIEEGGPLGLTPICLAAKEGFDRIVAYLASKGANLNTRDPHYKHPPLWHAARNGHLKVVAILLQYGASMGGTDQKGHTILDVTRHMPEMNQFLRSQGPHSNVATSNDSTLSGVYTGLGYTGCGAIAQAMQSFRTQTVPSAPAMSSPGSATHFRQPQVAIAQSPEHLGGQSSSPRLVASELPTTKSSYTIQDTRGPWYPPTPTASGYSHQLPPPRMPYANPQGAWSTGGFQRYPSNQYQGQPPSAYAANGWMENGISPQSKQFRGRIFLDKLLGRAVRVL